MLNVKTLQIDKLHNELLQAEIRSPNDSRLYSLIDLNQIALSIAGSQDSRIKQLSKHTATTIHNTCNETDSLSRHLFGTNNKYVLLWQFTTDHLEKNICQGSGVTNFSNVQQCIEKLHIKQTSWLLNQNVKIDSFGVKPDHQCTSCDYKLFAESSQILDNVDYLELSLPD